MDDCNKIVCDSCGKIFRTKKNLRRHVNSTHSDRVKVKKCDFENCDKMYSRNDYLASHFKRVHNLSSDEAVKRTSKIPKEEIERMIFVEERVDGRYKKTKEDHVQTNVPSTSASSCSEEMDLLDEIDSDFEMNFLDLMEDENCLPLDNENVDYLNEMLNTPEVQLSDEDSRPTENNYSQYSDISDASESETENQNSHTYQANNINTLIDEEIIETISINLIIHKVKYMDGTVSERREHSFNLSRNFDPTTFDWANFCTSLQEEIQKLTRCQPAP